MVYITLPSAYRKQGIRKVAMGEIFRSVAEFKGYEIGQSIGVPGSYAYHMVRDGKPVAVGMKSAYDRTVNTAYHMVTKVDLVWFVTFVWANGYEAPPTAVEVYETARKDLVDFYEAIHLARAKAGRDKDMTYIPLDVEALSDSRLPDYAKVSGHIGKIAKQIFSAPVRLDDTGPAHVVSGENEDHLSRGLDRPSDLAAAIAWHKNEVAKLYATTADKVRFVVEA